MTNIFTQEKIANQFNQYNDVLEQALGYQRIFDYFAAQAAQTILDYGCGPGKVAQRLAQYTDAQIIAVDASQQMIDIAKLERSEANIVYNVVHDNRLTWVPDDSIDSAIACYVMINNGSERHIQDMMREIFRVLKPGGQFMILDTNPKATGIPFSTFQNGETDKTYGYGAPRIEWLHLNTTEDLILHDFHWPVAMYETNLVQAGFDSVTLAFPTIAQLSAAQRQALDQQYGEHEWGNERTQAPFIFIQATKPQMK